MKRLCPVATTARRAAIACDGNDASRIDGGYGVAARSEGITEHGCEREVVPQKDFHDANSFRLMM